MSVTVWELLVNFITSIDTTAPRVGTHPVASVPKLSWLISTPYGKVSVIKPCCDSFNRKTVVVILSKTRDG
jgi:hypothetical protein